MKKSFRIRVSAAETNNRFGRLSPPAKREPVFVEKAGHLDTVIMPAEHYFALEVSQNKANQAARKKTV